MLIILIILGVATFVIGYVVLMNYLGGEKHLIGNRIRETIRRLR